MTSEAIKSDSETVKIEGDNGRAAPMQSALESSGFKVNTAGPTGVPADIGGLAGYDLVILSDVRAQDLATIQIEALASYARDLGGGLIMMGGDRSLGPGGYARTPIEDISPVAFDLKEEKRRASLAGCPSVSSSSTRYPGSGRPIDPAFTGWPGGLPTNAVVSVWP